MSKTKSLLSLVLCLVLCVSVITGCGAGKNKQTSKDDNTKSNVEKKEDDKKGTDIDTSPITLTMFSVDVNPVETGFQSPVAKKITEATGVTIEFEYPVGDVAQKMGIMIASKEYPDMIFAKTQELTQLVQADAIVDLTSLIEQHGPNVENLYGEYLNRLRFSQEDPSIYALGASPVDEETWAPVNGFQLQHAVVKDLGFPKLETLEDYENAIREYMKKYPTIDGQPTIGLSLLADDWRWLISVGNPAGFATGAPDDGNWFINPKTYEAKYRFTREEEKEYYRWLNHMYNEGLIDPDSFVQTWDQYIAKISTGRVLAIADANWEFGSAEDALRADGKAERTYGMYPLQLTKDSKHQDFRDVGYSGGNGICITKDSPNQVRAMQFLDWMCTDEAQILNNWGIEGIHYTVEDGKRVVSDEEYKKRTTDGTNYKKETGIEVYTHPFPRWGRGKLDSTGNPYVVDSVDLIKQRYTEPEKEVLKAYGVEMWKDLYPSRDEIPKSDWGAAFLVNIPAESEIPVILERCDSIMRQSIVQSIIAKPGEFDDVWQKAMDELKSSGVEEMNKDFTNLVNKQIEFWK
ncbi:MAG: extracellular solute-binding protein [Epulopiscium sp.]|nr:extracellular solute-binding protein [Candidatus Epulonipiscium sp.]